MKYIKEYEGLVNDGIYWRINGKSIDIIRLSLLQIGITKDDTIYHNIMDKESSYLVDNHKHLYVGLGYDFSEYTQHWWYSYNLQQFKGKYEYKGQIKVSDVELDAEKFNI